MVQRTFTLKNDSGLHARPASLFVQTVQGFAGTEVRLRKAEREVNARSLLSVLSLGAAADSDITVTCEGSREAEAMEALAALVAGNFGE
jgi:phosphocarrier protein